MGGGSHSRSLVLALRAADFLQVQARLFCVDQKPKLDALEHPVCRTQARRGGQHPKIQPRPDITTTTTCSRRRRSKREQGEEDRGTATTTPESILLVLANSSIAGQIEGQLLPSSPQRYSDIADPRFVPHRCLNCSHNFFARFIVQPSFQRKN